MARHLVADMSHRDRTIKSVLFRVDGGSEYGVAMGHVYRCLRLAKWLSAYGIESIFCMKQNLASHSLVQSGGFATYSLPQDAAQKQLSDCICRLAVDRGALLFIDLRGPKKSLVNYARQEGIPTIVYDDVFEDGLVPDVLINPTESDRHRYLHGGVEYLLGRRYIILDPRQSEYRKDGYSAVVNKLFVCLGGADPCNLTTRITKLLLRKFHTLHLYVAIGPAFQHTAELNAVIAEYGRPDNVTVCRENNFLAPIMNQTDAAITSGGTVMCEAINLYLPVLALPTIDHEVGVVTTYSEEGLVSGGLCDVNTITDDSLESTIRNFVLSQTGRHDIFKAQKLGIEFDGGAEIAECIRRICDAGGAVATT